MSNESRIISTNSNDAYLLSPEHSQRVESWLKKCQKTPTKELELFIDTFPEDGDVINYLESGKSSQSLGRLNQHISIIKSRVPLTLYFDLNGLTNDKLTKTLAKLVDSQNEETSLRAINTVFKLKFPEEKAIRITPTQKNVYNIKTDDKDRKELIKGILEKLNNEASSS